MDWWIRIESEIYDDIVIYHCHNLSRYPTFGDKPIKLRIEENPQLILAFI